MNKLVSDIESPLLITLRTSAGELVADISTKWALYAELLTLLFVLNNIVIF